MSCGQTNHNQYHILSSGGGARAVLAGPGIIAVLEKVGLTDFATVGAVSGSTIPFALWKRGFNARQLIAMAIDIDFASKLHRTGSRSQLLFAYFMHRQYMRLRPTKGVIDATPLGEFLDGLHPEGLPAGAATEWPDNFWTMAVDGEMIIIFNNDGVWQIAPDGTRTELSTAPVALGLAVTSSCAIPGVVSSVQFNERFLFDGACSRAGYCPVEVLRSYFGAEPGNIIAIDVVGEETYLESYLKFWEMVWSRMPYGGWYLPPPPCNVVTKDDVAVLIKPKLDLLHPLDFSPDTLVKVEAVMSGIMAAVEALAGAGIVSAERLGRLPELVAAYQSLPRGGKRQTRAERILALLREHELY